jgi:hypothetical protein
MEKLNAKDLRIDNYYQVNSKVYKIDINDLADLIRHEKTKFISNMEPIKLTEEWLKNFGFRIDDKEYIGGEKSSIKGILWLKGIAILQQIDRFYLLHFCDVDSWYSILGIKIESVHQLQNLYFALMGQNLNLKNN